jgi:hypothetical protein
MVEALTLTTPEAPAPASELPPVEATPPAFEPPAFPVIEVAQEIVNAPELASLVAPATHRSQILFVDYGPTKFNAPHYRNLDEVFRQTGSDSGDSQLLLLSTTRSRHKGGAEFNSELDRWHGDDSSNDLSDVDDAFESIAASHVARNSHRHALAGVQ